MNHFSERYSFNLLFFINRSKVKSDGTCPIMLRITIQGRLVASSIQRRIRPELWEAQTGMAVGDSEEARTMNKFIDAIKMRACDRYNDLLMTNEVVTPEMLRDAIFSINEGRGRSLVSVWEEHNTDLMRLVGRETSYTNWQKNNTCLNYLREFLRSEGKSEDLPVRLVNRHLITRFEQHLKIDRGCSANTATKYMQNLKKIIRIAMQNGRIKGDPFTGIRLSIQDNGRPYLTREELDAILKKDFDAPRLNTVRDIFMFACYTGLAYIDIHALTRSSLEADAEGITWIRTQRIKTKVRANVPLLDMARRIMDKYATPHNQTPVSRVLPVLSNQKMNAYLKEIADICGIRKKLTFHVARHTFATTITLMNGVPIESVSRMLGHTNIKTTQHYARIVDTKVGEDMRRLAVRMGCGLG